MKRAFWTAVILVIAAGPLRAQYATRAAVFQPPDDSGSVRSHSAGAKTGALWGAGVGFVFGVVGAATGEDCTQYGDGIPGHCAKIEPGVRMALTAASTVLGAIVGAGIGAIIGKRVEDTSHDRVTVGLGPSGARVALAF